MRARNTMLFQDLCKGKFGRKTAYVNYDKVTEDNILTILSKTIGVFNSNKDAIDYLWNYKKGDQPTLYRNKDVRPEINNKVIENHAYEIVQFAVAQTYGEPLQYISTSEDEKVNEAVDELNAFMRKAFKHQRNTKQGEWKAAVGTSYLAIQRGDNSDKPFRITVPNPMNTYVVYSLITDEPILAVQEQKDDDGQFYYMCYSDANEYTVKNSGLMIYDTTDSGVHKYSRPHAFGGIPIVEVPNNQDRLSDIEIVITLLDAVNNMQSNRMDGVEQFVQSWIKFVNCEIDEESFKAMRNEGALAVESIDNKNADVDIMTVELNQSETQVAKDDLWNNALSILAIPNKESGAGGDTQGAVELRNGWDFAKSRARLKDAYVIEAETRFAEVALNVLRQRGHNLGITINDFEVNIPHSPQDNMSTKANVLTLLLTAGIHPLIALKTAGLWSDPEKVYLLSQPYLSNIYKTVDEAMDEAISQLPDAEEQLTNARLIAGNGSGAQIPQNEEKANTNTSVLRDRLLNAQKG